LTCQNAGIQELCEHAFNAVRVLAHVFQKQDAALDLRKIRRAHEGAQDGQIATPQTGMRDTP
jgi:hypothetical protein